MYLQSVSMMPKGIFYADPRLANYLYFEMPYCHLFFSLSQSCRYSISATMSTCQQLKAAIKRKPRRMIQLILPEQISKHFRSYQLLNTT
jgi:hypothetical protein